MAWGKQLKVLCGECGEDMILKKSRHGLFYSCSKFPVCRGSHGAHQGSGLPLGKPAKYETRRLRSEAHKIFDGYWKRIGLKKYDAYKFLANLMQIAPKKAHIALFNKSQCTKLIKKIKKRQQPPKK